MRIVREAARKKNMFYSCRNFDLSLVRLAYEGSRHSDSNRHLPSIHICSPVHAIQCTAEIEAIHLHVPSYPLCRKTTRNFVKPALYSPADTFSRYIYHFIERLDIYRFVPFENLNCTNFRNHWKIRYVEHWKRCSRFWGNKMIFTPIYYYIKKKVEVENSYLFIMQIKSVCYLNFFYCNHAPTEQKNFYSRS